MSFPITMNTNGLIAPAGVTPLPINTNGHLCVAVSTSDPDFIPHDPLRQHILRDDKIIMKVIMDFMKRITDGVR
jgi:hypothetical protein